MMQLDNTFRVSLPIADTWKVLTDLPRVATCLPGAHLDEVVEGEYRGGLSAKIGPINARYRGVASFAELDEVGYRAVISARGKEEKGSGSAAATITATLLPDGDDATRVQVSTSMNISGRAAQFGRSLLSEVSTTLLAEFVRRLEAMISGSGAAATAAGAATPDAAAATAPPPHQQPKPADTLDLASTVAWPLMRRATVPIGVAVVSMIIGVLIGRKAGGR